MTALLTTTALALPILCAALWLELLIPRGLPARGALIWGTGTLLGLLCLPLLMRALHALGLPLDFTSTALVLGLLALPAPLLARRRPAPPTGMALQEPVLSSSQRLLFAGLLGLLALRLVTLGLEVLWRPLFPWDATMHWATKARVWFEYRSLVPFVSHEDWLWKYGGTGVFTDQHPHYPPAIPLLQVWLNLALGHWNESLMNLPWVACFAGLGAAFYGQLRIAGVTAINALAFTYLLLSMPLLNTHVALAGYADLFIGAAYGCALMALHNWITRRETWLACLTVLFALLCPMVKNEGLFWGLSLVPALTVAFLQRRRAAQLLLAIALLGALLVLAIPRDLVIAGISLNYLKPGFHLGAMPGLLKSVWLHANWHLFGYLLLMLMPLGLLLPGALTRTYLGLSIALACAGSAFLFLFLFTGFGWGAETLTAVGRLSLHLAPGVMFLCALLFQDLQRRGGLLRPAPT